MSDEIGPVRVDSSRAPAALQERCANAAKEIIQRQAKRAQEILDRKKGSLDRIANALLERNRLLKDELLALFADSTQPTAVAAR